MPLPIPIHQTAPHLLTSPPPTTSISFDLIYSYVEPYLLSCAHWLNDWWDEDWGVGEFAFLSLIVSMSFLAALIWILSRLCRRNVRLRRARRRRRMGEMRERTMHVTSPSRDLEDQWAAHRPLTFSHRPLALTIPVPVALPVPLSPAFSSTSYDASSSSCSSSIYEGSETDYDLHSMSSGSSSSESGSEPTSPVILPVSLGRHGRRDSENVMLVPVAVEVSNDRR